MKFNIIHIEDEPEPIEEITKIFDSFGKASGYQVNINLIKNIESLEASYSDTNSALHDAILAFVDIRLDDLSENQEEGIDCVRYIRKHLPNCVVVGYSYTSKIKKMFEAGAHYFFNKDSYQDKEFHLIFKNIFEEMITSRVSNSELIHQEYTTINHVQAENNFVTASISNQEVSIPLNNIFCYRHNKTPEVGDVLNFKLYETSQNKSIIMDCDVEEQQSYGRHMNVAAFKNRTSTYNSVMNRLGLLDNDVDYSQTSLNINKFKPK